MYASEKELLADEHAQSYDLYNTVRSVTSYN